MNAASARLHFSAAALSVAGSAWCAQVLAQEPAAGPGASERIALAYSAPSDCPSEDSFRAEVRARVTSEWEAQPGELARRIAVVVVLRGERYVATIEFLNPQGERVTRSVAGKSCDDVVNGIALVTALAVQSRVDEALEQSEPATPAPATALTPEPAAAAAPAPTPEPPKPNPAPAPSPSPSPPRSVEPAASSRTHLRVGGAVAVATGVGPVPTVGPAFFAAVEWDGPRLGVAGEAFWSGTVETNGVPAHFRRLAARVEGCPLSLPVVAKVAFEPCAFLELGSLRGDGELAPPALAQPGGGASLWVAPGAAGRLIVSFEPLILSIEATVRVPLLREKFGVTTADSPETLEVYVVPAIAVGGALGLGIRL